MKIFNDFDTSLKGTEYSDAIKKHGKENVLLIQRYTAFWIIRGIIPLFVALAIEIGGLMVAFGFKGELIFLFRIIASAEAIFGIIFLYYLLNIYLDYKFDFSIVTPEGILTYKQLGILDSKFKDLPAGKIRSISARRDGLLGNIFGYGSIEIITDGGAAKEDSEGRSQGGRTKFTYARRPNELRRKISEICLLKYSK